MSVGKTLRVAGKAVTIFGVVLFVLAVRVVTSSQSELSRAEHLARHGDLDESIVHYRRAASWYAPGNPYVETAIERLSQIGARAERDGDAERALLAFRSIRGAIMTSRSFYTPHRDRLASANQRIARLMAAEEPPPIDAGKTQSQLEAEHLELLSAPVDVDVGWSLVLLLGFATWVGGAFAFATRAIDAEDRVVPTAARLWGTTVIVGFGLFVLGMTLA